MVVLPDASHDGCHDFCHDELFIFACIVMSPTSLTEVVKPTTTVARIQCVNEHLVWARPSVIIGVGGGDARCEADNFPADGDKECCRCL